MFETIKNEMTEIDKELMILRRSEAVPFETKDIIDGCADDLVHRYIDLIHGTVKDGWGAEPLQSALEELRTAIDLVLEEFSSGTC